MIASWPETGLTMAFAVLFGDLIFSNMAITRLEKRVDDLERQQTKIVEHGAFPLGDHALTFDQVPRRKP